MKAIAAAVFCAAVTLSCATQKEVEVNEVDVKLVKIEVVQRYPDFQRKMLTWRDANRVDYVTFAPLSNEYKLGAVMKVMMRR